VEIDPPPSLDGALNATDIWALEGVTTVMVGADGVVRGVAVAVAVVPAPIPFVGVTVNVYKVPFVKPVKVHEVFEVPVQEAGGVTDGLEVTEYVTAPPFELDAPQEITDWVFSLFVALAEVGAVGAVIV
jgi:hypothetical protein